MMYVIIAATTVITAFVAAVAFPFFLKWLAEENILVTTVKEGTVKAIMRGKNFERFLMSFEGYHLNDPFAWWYGPSKREWEVLSHDRKDGKWYDNRPWLLKKLGLYWVGWPWVNSVYVYMFEWNETYLDKDGKTRVISRMEATDFIYVADFTYAMVTEDGETKDRITIDVLTLVTVAIRNPYRALFSGVDWMRRVGAAINRYARTFIGERDLQDLIQKQHSTEYSGPLIRLTETLPDDAEEAPEKGLEGRYGVLIRTADFQTLEPTGTEKMKQEYKEAMAKLYIAEQNAKAIKVEGQAKADVIAMVGKKEAASLEKRLVVIDAHESTGPMLAQLDAMQEAAKGPGNTLIWANDPFVAVGAKLLGKSKIPEKGEKS